MAERHDMRALIAGLGDQMKEALLSPISPEPAAKLTFRGVAILGMGGSGIGGAIMSDMLRLSSAIPVVAVSDRCCLGGSTSIVWSSRRAIQETRKRPWLVWKRR